MGPVSVWGVGAVDHCEQRPSWAARRLRGRTRTIDGVVQREVRRLVKEDFEVDRPLAQLVVDKLIIKVRERPEEEGASDGRAEEARSVCVEPRAALLLQRVRL